MSHSTAIPINLEVFEHPRHYEPRSFVNRETELEIVAKKVRSAQGGTPISEPVINFWGVSGIGKTWLIRHIHHLYRYTPPGKPSTLQPTFALLLQFQPDPAAHTLDAVTRALARDALKQLGAVLEQEEVSDLSQAAETGKIDEFIRAVQSLSKRLIPLLLFDNAEKLESQAWENLEMQVIEPLVSTNRVLVVISGRRQAPRWRRFEVRRRVMESDTTQVLPFTHEGVERQLRSSNYHLPASSLVEYSAGHPLLVDAVARNFDAWRVKSDAPLDDAHRSALVQILRAAEVKLLESIPAELRGVLYSIIPLRSYLGEALRYMLEEAGEEYRNLKDVYFVQLLRRLDGTESVWWDKAQRAYTTSQVVRKLVNWRMLLEDSRAFIQIHRRALDMYWSWAQEIPKVSEDYLQEILFHLGMIYQADRDRKALQDSIATTLNFARKYLGSDRKMRLKQAIVGDGRREGDQELRDLLSEDLFRKLSAELTALIDHASQPGEEGG